MPKEHTSAEGLQEYLSTGEAASILGVHPVAVWQMIQADRLPAMKVGRNWIISREALLEFADGYVKGPGRRSRKKRTRRGQE